MGVAPWGCQPGSAHEQLNQIADRRSHHKRTLSSARPSMTLPDQRDYLQATDYQRMPGFILSLQRCPMLPFITKHHPGSVLLSGFLNDLISSAACSDHRGQLLRNHWTPDSNRETRRCCKCYHTDMMFIAPLASHL